MQTRLLSLGIFIWFSLHQLHQYQIQLGKICCLSCYPLYIKFFVVIFCKINALSPQLHGFVQISQAFGAAINIRIILFVDEGYSLTIAKLIVVSYGFVNLDFFRSYMNNICIDLGTIQTLALDYVVAVYPLLLVILSYILIELHARNFRFIWWIWKPFRRVFSGNWDVHSSIIKTFATFLLLSYGMLLSVTFDLLIPSKLYNVMDWIGLRQRTSFWKYSWSLFCMDYQGIVYAILSLWLQPQLLVLYHDCQTLQSMLFNV